MISTLLYTPDWKKDVVELNENLLPTIYNNDILKLTWDLAFSRCGVFTNLYHKGVSSSKSIKKWIKKKAHNKKVHITGTHLCWYKKRRGDEQIKRAFKLK